jgi:hypothetical protein
MIISWCLASVRGDADFFHEKVFLTRNTDIDNKRKLPDKCPLASKIIWWINVKKYTLSGLFWTHELIIEKKISTLALFSFRL